MSFAVSKAVLYGVKNALQDMGMKPETASLIGVAACFHTVGAVAAHQANLASSPEQLEAIKSTWENHETSSEAVNLITTDSDALLDEMESIMASVETEHYYNYKNLDSNKTEEVFSQIDLAQARIIKDQEEIQSLAAETDDLLNQLEYKAI